MKVIIKTITPFITPLLFTMSFTAMATNNVIEPPMVAIPSGSFLMGNESGPLNEKPVRQVQINAFMLGKYEVTIAEFKQFVDTTNYPMPQTCVHEAGPNWFLRPSSDSKNNQQGRAGMELAVTSGSWDNNSISNNEFEPVVCIGWNAAKAYIAWLKQETGKPYRLPSEAEWEYAHRAGSTSTYAFGERADMDKVCHSSNVADKYAEEVAAKLFKAGYGGRPEPCNDKSGLVSIVGLYQPNAFGLYDTLGNVEEWMQDCYVDDYVNAPVNAQPVELANCKQRVLRGGSWHYLTYSASQRAGREQQDFVGVLEGFRLALDGDKVEPTSSTLDFEKQLHNAQKKQQQKRNKLLDFPQKATGLKLTKSNTPSRQYITLNWDNLNDIATFGYDIYRSNSYFDNSHKIASNVKGFEFTDVKPTNGHLRYSIVAVNAERQSPFSDIVTTGRHETHSLPGKVQAEAFHYSSNAVIAASISEPKGDNGYIRLSGSESQYKVTSNTDAAYKVTFRVFNNGQNQSFEFWQEGKLVTTLTPTGNRGWQSLILPEVYLPTGKNLLSIKTKDNNFSINWLQFEKI